MKHRKLEREKKKKGKGYIYKYKGYERQGGRWKGREKKQEKKKGGRPMLYISTYLHGCGCCMYP